MTLGKRCDSWGTRTASAGASKRLALTPDAGEWSSGLAGHGAGHMAGAVPTRPISPRSMPQPAACSSSIMATCCGPWAMAAAHREKAAMPAGFFRPRLAAESSRARTGLLKTGACRAGDSVTRRQTTPRAGRKRGPQAGPAVEHTHFLRGRLERVMGIEPTYAAWEARLKQACSVTYLQNSLNSVPIRSRGYELTTKLFLLAGKSPPQ